MLGAASGAASASVSTDFETYLDSADDYNHVSFDGDWKQWFTNTHGGYVSTTTNHSRDGNALRIYWPAGQYYGGTMEYHMLNHHGYQPDAGHVRYWVYFPDDWQFHSDGLGGTKLPGFAATYQTGDHDIGPGGYGGRPSDGTNGWSTRPFNCRPDRANGNGPIGMGSQVYHAGDGGRHGAHPRWNDGLETGRWYQIDQYVEMNSSGEADGIYRTWIDGELALNMEDLYFRAPGYEDLIGIQTFWAVFYFGGDWGSPVDQYMLFDDLELWTWADRPEESYGHGDDGGDDDGDEPATVETGDIDAGEESATVEAIVDGIGDRTDVELWVAYGDANGSDWAGTGGDVVTKSGSYDLTIDGLSPDTEYDVRTELWANGNKVDFGDLRTFVTDEENDGGDDDQKRDDDRGDDGDDSQERNDGHDDDDGDDDQKRDDEEDETDPDDDSDECDDWWERLTGIRSLSGRLRIRVRT